MELKDLKLTARRYGLLQKMKIRTLEDLLKTYPFRYETIEAVPYEEWQKGDHIALEALVSSRPNIIRLGGGRTMTRFTIIAWGEELEVTLFNRPWVNQFRFGTSITLFGTYQGNNKITVTNYNLRPLREQTGLRPVYSLPKTMKPSDMSAIMKTALKQVDQVPDLIPARYRQKYRLLSKNAAYQYIHLPQNMKQLHAAIRTLKYEEFLCFQCCVQAQQVQTIAKDPKVFDQNRIQEKIDSFRFPLTEDQNTAIQDILRDMRSDTVMYRMVQGDVGCGKTIVAMMSLYACDLAGYQGAFLAPTEILARQHYENMKNLGLPVRLLVASLPAKEKREVLAGLEAGQIRMVVGTHALFQEKVNFDDLGLVVADEQQRFGVNQRRSLLEKGKNVDFLMMSATPIPRTYAHFLYGDIQLSAIRTMPPGRRPVRTHYVPGSSMKTFLKQVLAGIGEGRQCYVVCPMIDENLETNLKAVTTIYEGMEKTLGKKYRIGLLHGKMSAQEKEEIMEKFSNKEYDFLVSTTVIEVGIDVPDATMMVIYDAHRFGLSTLHQLRGRAARGKVQGECWMLSDTKDAEAIERLKKLETMTDGFAISAYDLSKRGPGDLLGTRQSGLPTFILGDFEKDPAIMEVCVHDAREILAAGKDREMLDYVKSAAENARYFD